MRLLLSVAATAFAAFSTLAPSPDPINAGFIGVVGDTTVVLAETAIRTDSTLEGSIALLGDAIIRAGYSALLLPEAQVNSLSVWQEPLDGQGERQSFDVTIESDSVRMVSDTPGAAKETFVGGPGAIPYINPSIGLLEQVVLRALALRDGGDVVTVPLFYISGQEQLTDADVRFVTPDSVHVVVSVGGQSFTTAARIDADEGLVLSGGSLDGSFHFKRVSYEDAAARLMVSE